MFPDKFAKKGKDEKKEGKPSFSIGGKVKPTKSSPFDSDEEKPFPGKPASESAEIEIVDETKPEKPEMAGMAGSTKTFISDEMSCSECSHFQPEGPKCGIDTPGADYSKYDPTYSRCPSFEKGGSPDVPSNEEKVGQISPELPIA